MDASPPNCSPSTSKRVPTLAIVDPLLYVTASHYFVLILKTLGVAQSTVAMHKLKVGADRFFERSITHMSMVDTIRIRCFRWHSRTSFLSFLLRSFEKRCAKKKQRRANGSLELIFLPVVFCSLVAGFKRCTSYQERVGNLREQHSTRALVNHIPFIICDVACPMLSHQQRGCNSNGGCSQVTNLPTNAPLIFITIVRSISFQFKSSACISLSLDKNYL